MTHADIIARLTAATGPDREIDAAIWCLTNGWRWRGFNPSTLFYAVAVEDSTYLNRNSRLRHAAKYTASVDACLALIERVLPLAWPTIDKYSAGDNPSWRAWVKSLAGDVDGDGPCGLRKGFGRAPTPALAALLALFRALETTGVPHHG